MNNQMTVELKQQRKTDEEIRKKIKGLEYQILESRPDDETRMNWARAERYALKWVLGES